VAAFVGGQARGGWSLGNATSYVLSYADMSGPSRLAPQALASSPFPASWNGSLWSLRYEVGCYVAVGLALCVPWLWRQTWAVVAALGLATAAKLAIDQTGGGQGLVSELALLLPYFLAGVVILRFADRLPLTGRGALVAGAALACGLLLHRGEALAPLPLAYVVLGAGAAAPASVKRIGSRNDISYGTYLYAFPVQQLLVLAGAAKLGVAAFIGLSAVMTMPLAAASWFAVERPAMLARHLPARWRRGASVTMPTPSAASSPPSTSPRGVSHVAAADVPPQ
jgi:peptidoglycan/LPS O-acetylase OafA/YrhL